MRRALLMSRIRRSRLQCVWRCGHRVREAYDIARLQGSRQARDAVFVTPMMMCVINSQHASLPSVLQHPTSTFIPGSKNTVLRALSFANPFPDVATLVYLIHQSIFCCSFHSPDTCPIQSYTSFLTFICFFSLSHVLLVLAKHGRGISSSLVLFWKRYL